MKRSVTFLSAFLMLLAPLMFTPTDLHAQKWNSLKKALSAKPRWGALTTSARTQIKRAVVRAARRNVPPDFRHVTYQKGVYSFFSPKALLPNVSQMTSQDHLPSLPFAENDREMYRGMVLDADGKQLRSILSHGLKTAKSHHENFHAYDGKKYPKGTKAIYATINPNGAVFYVLKPAGQTSRYLPVVLHLKRVSDDYIISVPHNIPPSWIYRVSALLRINGQLTWGELKLENNTFHFTPYPPNMGETNR